MPAAPVSIRPDRTIHSIDGGWFRARWHFSFDDYRDPNNMGVGRMRVFNHDTLVAGGVWPMHPHRDVEGITYVVAGHFEHADSIGGGGILEAGGVQRMTLGSGAQHSERNHSQTEEIQFLQLWILPDHRGLKPELVQRQHTTEDRHNRWLRIIRPMGAEGTGVTVHQDASIYVARLDRGVRVEYRIEDGRGGYLYLVEGDAEVNDEHLTGGDAVYVTGAGSVRVRAHGTSELLMVDTPL